MPGLAFVYFSTFSSMISAMMFGLTFPPLLALFWPALSLAAT